MNTCVGTVFLLGSAFAVPVPAQLYPARPVRLIVPIAPGSVTDVILRAAGRELSARLGQAIVIDNRAGGGGVIGGELCAKAPPDGHTVCAIYTATTSINPHLFDRLPYDPARDFAPIAHLYYVTGALVVPASLPVGSVEELRALAAARPRAVNFGTIGPGSYPEVFLAWLNNRWQVNLTGVPYKGGRAGRRRARCRGDPGKCRRTGQLGRAAEKRSVAGARGLGKQAIEAFSGRADDGRSRARRLPGPPLVGPRRAGGDTPAYRG